MKRLLLLTAVFAGAAGAADMTVLHYVDQDAGDPAYATRILVTPSFLRMDGGDDAGDFVLLDRKHRKLYNVMRDSRLAMVFSQGTVPPKPADWQVRVLALPAAQGVRGYRLLVGDVACSEGTVVPRAEPDAARAMAELGRVLAATQYRVWKDSPRELQHDCDLANQVWNVDAVPKLGLPNAVREFNGKARTLESRARQPLRPELFRVPAGLPLIDAPS